MEYTREYLEERIQSGEPIEGWCKKCDRHWNLNEQARAGIAKELAR